MNRSRTVVVAVPSLAVRVVVVRSRSAPPCAPSSIRANDSSVRIAPARVLACENCRYFADWIAEVIASGATYERLDSSRGTLDLGDPAITVEIVGPILESDGTLRWLSSKAKTINGHSLTFRMIHGAVRTFFSGDLNERGSRHLLDAPAGALRLNAHVFKAPHHGSHDYDEDLLAAVNPMITVVSSGEIPDHGHPRANFLAAIGRASRGPEPLLFSTELAALFVDAHDADTGATGIGGWAVGSSIRH